MFKYVALSFCVLMHLPTYTGKKTPVRQRRAILNNNEKDAKSPKTSRTIFGEPTHHKEKDDMPLDALKGKSASDALRIITGEKE